MTLNFCAVTLNWPLDNEIYLSNLFTQAFNKNGDGKESNFGDFQEGINWNWLECSDTDIVVVDYCSFSV